jgi:hypothetical protein
MTPSTIENTEAVNPDGELRQGLFAAQAARIVELQAEIAIRQEEVDELKARILDSHPAGTYQAGNLKVQVKPGARRINAGTFEKAYPATAAQPVGEAADVGRGGRLRDVGQADGGGLMSAELSSLGIAQIVESAIADYDLHDENGNELTDDLYVIRSERIADLGFEVAKRIRKATHELEQGGKTGHSIHSMTFGSVPVTIAKDGDRTYTLRFDNSDEAVAITRLSRTALADIRKQINDFLKEVKNHEHE